LLYLILGRAYMPRKRLRIQKKAAERIQRAQSHIRETPLAPSAEVIRPIVNLVSRIGEFVPLRGNRIELLTDYDRSIQRLIRDIDTAERHVHLLYYIFEDDATGRSVADALSRAAHRGVACRVLMDSIGSRRALRRLAPGLRAAGAEVLEMLPVGLLRSRTVRFDLRNHRKIAVIDGRIGYIGSQNIVDSDWKTGIVNEDLVARVQGPILSQLQMVFLADWYLETDARVTTSDLVAEQGECGGSPAQLLPSGPGYGRANVEMLMVTLLHNASKRVVITTPYFIPDQPLLQAMETAVLRGVDVHLVLSAKSDQKIVSTAQHSYYDQLLRGGVSIHLYQPRFLHAKCMTVDESVAVIGSSNVDIRSFALNSEISLLVYDSDVVAAMAHVQDRYISESKTLTARAWNRRSPVRKALQSIARLADALL
jgi:cardiolipin synthase A/B